MRPAALIVIGSAVLASAMLAASDARASLDLAGVYTIAPFERALAVADFVPAAPYCAPVGGDLERSSPDQPGFPALDVGPRWDAARGAQHGTVRPASTPSSSTRKVTRPPGTHRRHARLRHSDPNLRAHHPRANALPPTRRPARPRVPPSGRHAPSPQVRHRDGGSRTLGATGLPATATGPLSLAVLGTCANQRDRARIQKALEHLEGRGPPRAGPIDASAVASTRGAPAHLPRARALTHPHGWAPCSRAPHTPHLSSLSRLSPAALVVRPAIWPARPPPPRPPPHACFPMPA